MAEFGIAKEWQFQLNAEADEKAGKLAAAASKPGQRSTIREVDHLASTILGFLAQRAEILLTEGQDFRDRQTEKPKQGVPLKPKQGGQKQLDKRQRMQQMLEKEATGFDHQ